MTPTKDRNLTGADRMTLKAVMDRMVPPTGEMPGAGSLALAEEVEHMARRVPGLASALLRTLDALSLDPGARVAGGFLALEEEARDEAIRTIESTLPVAFALLLDMVYTAYYSDGRVHERIGWASDPPQQGDSQPEPFDESALDKVRGREPFWRSDEQRPALSRPGTDC